MHPRRSDPKERPASPPAPVLTAGQAGALRADLEASGWSVDAVAALLGPVAEAALRRELRLPALRVLRAALDRAEGRAPSPVVVLTAQLEIGRASCRERV